MGGRLFVETETGSSDLRWINPTMGGVKFDDPKCVKNGFFKFLLDLFINKAIEIEICQLKRSLIVIRISNNVQNFETLSI